MTARDAMQGLLRFGAISGLVFGFVPVGYGAVKITGAGVAVAQESGQPAPGAKPDTAPESDPGPEPGPVPPYEGAMTLEHMGEIILRLDENAQTPRKGVWQFAVEQTPVLIVTDEKHNRMRILVAIRKVDDLAPDLLLRLLQANFDTALDGRYAVARGLLWATHIHPLRAHHDRQFISAIGQTVNLAKTFGTTFSSGALNYRGGDSRGIIQRQLIDKLLKKGLPI